MTPYYQDSAIRVYHADVTAGIPLPDGSVQCVVTSPPYFGLRDYGTATWEGGAAGCDHKRDVKPSTEHIRQPGYADAFRNQSARANHAAEPRYLMACPCGARRIDAQLGLEKTPEDYVARMVAVFRELRRVLRDDGALWCNMGDGFSDKQLVGMPWRLAFALQADGWWLRSEIIWAKPNPMPESVTDRPTKSHEQIFLLTKRGTYYYDADAVREPASQPLGEPRLSGGHSFATLRLTGTATNNGIGTSVLGSNQGASHRNLRTVWTIATAPFSGAHFATFPPDLAARCILAGTSEKGACPVCGAPWARVVSVAYVKSPVHGSGSVIGRHEVTGANGWDGAGLPRLNKETTTTGWRPTCACGRPDTRPCLVLDPFAGALTTLHVAKELGRHAVGLELNAAYIDLGVPRCAQDVLPL